MSDIEPAQPRQPTPGGGLTGGHSTAVVRMLLIILGSAAIIASPFLPWAEPDVSVKGREIGVNVFWSATPDVGVAFLASAGLVVLIVGLIALIGLVPGSQAFGVLGGILGMAAAVLVAVSAFRGGLGFEELRVGLYLLAVGGLLVLLGSLIPSGPPDEPTPADPPREPETEPPPPA